MAKNTIKTGDTVVVIAGKDKGKTGEVKNFTSDGKCLVDGVNQVSKHQKENPYQSKEGGIVQKAMPIDRSNIAIYNNNNGKADKVGIKWLQDGTKVRYFKSTGEQID